MPLSGRLPILPFPYSNPNPLCCLLCEFDHGNNSLAHISKDENLPGRPCGSVCVKREFEAMREVFSCIVCFPLALFHWTGTNSRVYFVEEAGFEGERTRVEGEGGREDNSARAITRACAGPEHELCMTHCKSPGCSCSLRRHPSSCPLCRGRRVLTGIIVTGVLIRVYIYTPIVF
jgi:hypothetical protein